MIVRKTPVFIYTLSYVLFGVVFLTAAVLIGSISQRALDYQNRRTETVAKTADDNEYPVSLMLDPGHGGEDGGASSEDGTLEKHLNLQIADNIDHLCLLFGIPSKMTRYEDTMLYDYYSEYEDYTGKKKSLDLKNRLKIAEDSGAELFVGIHINKFPSSSVKGLQVYYSPNNEKSKRAAGLVQSYAKTYIQQDNTREIKKANSSIYLLKRMTIPAILIECGFLSNPDETAKLKTPEYRAKLACVVFSSAAEYLSS